MFFLEWQFITVRFVFLDMCCFCSLLDRVNFTWLVLFIYKIYNSLSFRFNNWNLLLELGEILKWKWHKTTKYGMLKLTYMKTLYLDYHPYSKHSSPFSSIKKLCNRNLNLTIHLGFRSIQFTIQEMVFRFYT